MINNKGYSRVFLSKASLGSIAPDAETPRAKSKFIGKVPTLNIQDRSLSRFSMRVHENYNEYGFSVKESPQQAKGGSQTTRELTSNYRLSTNNHSPCPMNFMKKTSNGGAGGFTSRGILPKILSVTDPYEALEIDPEEDYTQEYSLMKLGQAFSSFAKRDDTTTFVQEGQRKQASVKAAKIIIENFMKDLRKLRNQKTVPDSPAASQSKLYNFNEAREQYFMIEKFDSMINELLDICEQALMMRKSKSKLDQAMKMLVDVSQKSENLELNMHCSYIHGKIYMARSDFFEAISHFRQFKDICVAHNTLRNQLRAYKCLGKSCQNLKKYQAAMRYYVKLLQTAWCANSSKHELLAYDMIGLQHFYMGRLELAQYYHNKMTACKLEPDNSNLKQIGIAKMKLAGRKDYQSSYGGGKRLTRKPTTASIIVKSSMNGQDNDDYGNLSMSKDDDLDLPIPNLQEDKDEEKVRKREEGREGMMNRDVLGMEYYQLTMRKKAPKMVVGMMKAKLELRAKEQAKEKKRSLDSGIPKREILVLNTEEKIKRITTLQRVPTKPSKLQSKPDEQIFVSHLSRNRQLNNFSSLMAHNAYIMSLGDMANDNTGDVMDLKAAEKVRKILEKLKINLYAIKKTLLAFGQNNHSHRENYNARGSQFEIRRASRLKTEE